RLAEACGSTPWRLAPGGTVRLNPLDPVPGTAGTGLAVPDPYTPAMAPGLAQDPTAALHRRAELVCSLASSSLGRALSPPERTAVELAARALAERSGGP